MVNYMGVKRLRNSILKMLDFYYFVVKCLLSNINIEIKRDHILTIYEFTKCMANNKESKHFCNTGKFFFKTVLL